MSSSGKGWSAGLPTVVGLVAITLLVGVLGVWSVFTQIAGAVVAPGVVQVENKRQVIQHPEGGVVGEIYARDGDQVAAGDVLVRFDDTYLLSELAIIERQLFQLSMRGARLEAERDERTEVAFSHVQDYASLAEEWVEYQIQGQVNLFNARRVSLTKESSQLRKQIAQIEEQIAGTQAQLRSLERQLGLIAQERNSTQNLYEKKLVPVSRLLDLQREEAVLEGEIGQLTSTVAEARERISELEIKNLKLKDGRRGEAIAQLNDLRYREIELHEKQISLRERLSRLDVKAPVDGVIFGSTVTATKSVVRPADPMMYIVPLDRPLQISARIDPIDIEQVFPGQDVILRFSNFDLRTTPEIRGKLSRRSADVLTDEVTGAQFYEAVVYPDPTAIAALPQITLLPGMPVETFLRTRDRTPFEYLTQPLTDYFKRVFR